MGSSLATQHQHLNPTGQIPREQTAREQTKTHHYYTMCYYIITINVKYNQLHGHKGQRGRKQTSINVCMTGNNFWCLNQYEPVSKRLITVNKFVYSMRISLLIYFILTESLKNALPKPLLFFEYHANSTVSVSVIDTFTRLALTLLKK